ncbi:S41 family peptidase [Sediminicola sp. 1XM1-17]|uniref:S41 family peptidase n=1 Tax=Sediminicola sp. 1XM1-17 TaxID=3127702 RepID=UPI0030776925
MKKILILSLGIGMFIASCSKDENLFTNPDTPDPVGTTDVTVQDFMWKAMNLWYFWQGNVPNLSDTKFTTDAEYTAFLESELDPELFFDNKLRFSEDRFSFFTDDYKELVQSFAGVSKSNGLEFGLSFYGEGNDIFGYVRYIVPNSDASTKAIQRGDIFTGVNGVSLNADNYIDLLFGDADSYTLNMADISNNTITPNNREVALTKFEGLVENPVFITKTFDISGKKIGYLMYNGFTSNFDEELNNAFGTLKAAGVTDLVLDFRYNPGGSVNSSRLLSSMVYGTNTNDLYIRQRWNSKIQPQLSSAQLNDYFADKTGAGSAINTLNLNKVYVLATGSSASASELVMNGLDPYVEVVHIGTTTRGKNEFSITLVDNASNSYIYGASSEKNINTKNSWGIQPLVGRNENSVGFFDYTAGFTPDIELREDLSNLGQLGDQNEPLLARAIQEITGVSAKVDFTVKMPVDLLSSSKMFTPMRDNMYLDKELPSLME